jgi:Sec-independent protein translocase protein TatA
MMGLSAVHRLIFGILAILLFSNRLPSVARSLARSLVEFKKGMNELEGEFRTSIYSDSQYEKQLERQRINTIPGESAFKIPPLYWPAFRFGILVQATLGVLTVLTPDMGQAFNVFKIAFLCHWLGIFLLFARRPMSPTKMDAIFVCWGTPLLMIATGLIAPLVLKLIQ